MQPLVKETPAGAVQEDDLHGVPSSPEEDEEGGLRGLEADRVAREAREPIEARAQIDGLDGDEDLNAVGDHGSPPIARTTEASRAGSNPRPHADARNADLHEQLLRARGPRTNDRDERGAIARAGRRARGEAVRPSQERGGGVSL